MPTIAMTNEPRPAAGVEVLDLAIEDLESLDAPVDWGWVAAGFVAGLAAGAIIAT